MTTRAATRLASGLVALALVAGACGTEDPQVLGIQETNPDVETVAPTPSEPTTLQPSIPAPTATPTLEPTVEPTSDPVPLTALDSGDGWSLNSISPADDGTGGWGWLELSGQPPITPDGTTEPLQVSLVGDQSDPTAGDPEVANAACVVSLEGLAAKAVVASGDIEVNLLVDDVPVATETVTVDRTADPDTTIVLHSTAPRALALDVDSQATCGVSFTAA